MVKWAVGANIYEVNIRQFSNEGTFNAFGKHLPRLKDMGVKILWLMPVTPISLLKRQGSLGSYYACSSYTEINPEFGTLEDFKALVSEVHAMDMKIIIDWVANHTGCDHHWTKEHPEYYLKDVAGNFTEKNGWNDVIDLDFTNNDMRIAMIDAMKFWIQECDIDGFRCDMAHLVPLDFWKSARKQCDSLTPLFWLAECDESSYLDIFDYSYAWEWMHLSGKMMRNEASLADMIKVLLRYNSDTKVPSKSYFTSNHDENSWNGTEYEKYGAGAKAFAIFSATWPGINLMYSGQELPNFKRLAFFDKDEIEWGNQKPLLHDFYKKLLTLRLENQALQDGASLELLTAENSGDILAFIMQKEKKKVFVILNFSNEDRKRVTFTHPLLKGVFKNIFSELEYSFTKSQSFELQGWESFVFESK